MGMAEQFLLQREVKMEILLTDDDIKKMEKMCPMVRKLKLGEKINAGVSAKISMTNIVEEKINKFDQIFLQASTEGSPSQRDRLDEALNTTESAFPTKVESALRSGNWSAVIAGINKAVQKGNILEEDKIHVFNVFEISE